MKIVKIMQFGVTLNIWLNFAADVGLVFIQHSSTSLPKATLQIFKPMVNFDIAQINSPQFQKCDIYL
jgi:hypothetical protein